MLHLDTARYKMSKIVVKSSPRRHQLSNGRADSLMKSTTDALEAGSQRPRVGSQADQDSKLSYMQRPPAILPNYGNRWKHGLRLKTNLPRVLLYDNVTQQTILDAHISYIQSQRYKSRRHLDMNIKSFLLWKQHKEKALLKLTQVQHGHDYAHFELQHYGSVSRTAKKIPENCSNGLVLPNIQRKKPGRITVTTSREENGKENQTDCLPALSYILRKERHTKLHCLPSHSAQENQSQHQSHLPYIKNMTPPQASNNGGFETNFDLGLVQQGNRKPQDEHNSAEVTSFTGPAFDNLRISHNQLFMKSPTVDINTSLNPPDDNQSIYGVHTLKANPEKHRSETNNIVVKNNSNELLRNKQVKMKHPVFDNRFLQLQNILVPQCPRNEGFTVLSPSFKNKKYFHDDK